MIPSQRRVLEKPASVTVELTRQCNVKCIHCYSSAGVGGFNPSSGVLKSILHKALDVEPFYLIFTGGEPFVRADLPDLMSMVYERTGQQMPEITIATNGQLISSERGEKVLDTASKINDLVGYPVIGIYVSLHGSIPEIHDRIMASSGAYARAVKGISMIKERGNIAFGVGCTPLRINYDDLDNIVNRALELGSPVLNFSQFVPTGRGAFAKGIDLTPEQYQNFVQWFVQRREELEEKILLVTHEPLEVMVYPVVSELEQYYGCPAAWLSATIEPDGTVYPCPLSPIAAGNVSETSLKDIWLNSAVFKQFRDRDNFSGVCGSCDLKWVCGGCRGTSLAYENTALGSDRRCWHYTSDGKERIGRINIVSNKTGKDLLTENIQKMLNRNVEDELLRKPLRQNSDGMIIKPVEKSISSNIKKTLGNYLVFRPPNPSRWNYSNTLHVLDRITRATIELDSYAGRLYLDIGFNGISINKLLLTYPRTEWRYILSLIHKMAEANILLLKYTNEAS